MGLAELEKEQDWLLRLLPRRYLRLNHALIQSKNATSNYILEKLLMGKELDVPVPYHYRDRVNSLCLPASSFPELGGSNMSTT
jgi:hypothetical protein